jgi:hypothetical protein
MRQVKTGNFCLAKDLLIYQGLRSLELIRYIHKLPHMSATFIFPIVTGFNVSLWNDQQMLKEVGDFY